MFVHDVIIVLAIVRLFAGTVSWHEQKYMKIVYVLLENRTKISNFVRKLGL